MMIAKFTFRNGDTITVDMAQPRQCDAMAYVASKDTLSGDVDIIPFAMHKWSTGTAEAFLKRQLKKELTRYCKRIERPEWLKNWNICHRDTFFGAIYGLEKWIQRYDSRGKRDYVREGEDG